MPDCNDKDDDDYDGDGDDDDDEGRDRDQHDNKAGGHVKLELRGRTGRCSAHQRLRQQRDSRADRGDDDEEDEDEDKDAGDMIGSAATKRYSRGLWGCGG